MNKQQKDREEKYKYLKFDCEMRAESVKIASCLSTSKNAKSLLENSEKIAKYIFGISEPKKEKK